MLLSYLDCVVFIIVVTYVYFLVLCWMLVGWGGEGLFVYYLGVCIVDILEYGLLYVMVVMFAVVVCGCLIWLSL